MKELYRSPRNTWRIFSYIITGVIIVSYISANGSTRAYAANIPQPIFPGDLAVTTSVSDPPLGVPSFSWLSVMDANVYRLQVDSEIDFNQPILLDVTTRNLTYTPSSTAHLFSDGEWYWRVRVEDPAPVSNWSPILHFTKTWATPENTPALLAPANGESLAFFDSPTFSWTPVRGAARYRFQIAADEEFSSITQSSDTITTTIQTSTRLANGTYYWRVIPMDKVDHFGSISDVNMLTLAYGKYAMDMVPKLITPLDDTDPNYTPPIFTPTFHWSAIIGAEKYRLEYTSDETCDFNSGTNLETRQTFYTPPDTFPNDIRYCWHVRVESGPAVGDWSETRHFQKKWNLQPQLLTSTNLYQTGLYPVYSWTPVPGASRYLIQIADNPSFVTNGCYQESITANTTYTPQTNYCGTALYRWRVKPIDGGGESGLTSNVAAYQSIYTSTAPILVYPLYYYLPNDPNYYGENTLNPYEDRTVAYPVFMWHRVIIPSPFGGVYAGAYRIQVDTTPYFNTDPLPWEYDTENTSATPIDADDFTPIVGQDYYWRVCPLDHLGGTCRTNPNSGLIWWSQIWKAHFDPSYDPENPNPWVLPPTEGTAPVLLRPIHGQESVEMTPLLEWWPLRNATQYQVEISRDPAFDNHEVFETVNIPAFTPANSLAQRSLGRTDYGTFYWHVRGCVSAFCGDWSAPWRFQIASQSEWRYTRTIGDPANRLLIGEDQTIDPSTSYDLTTLFASQSSTHWYLGFNANITSPDTTYVFYIDLDHVDGSGATAPPERPYVVTTIPAHRPEYAIYVDQIGGVINSGNTRVFAWNGSDWGFGQTLTAIGGSAFNNSGYIELQLPNAAIGMEQKTGSASMMLFSVNRSTNLVEDSVPSDPTVPGSAQLSRFSAVSDRMNLISPPNSITGDPRINASLLPFFWDWPTGSDPSNPFAGSRLEVHLDGAYTSLHADHLIKSKADTNYFSMNSDTLVNDIVGDNIYYWRVQPRYKLPGHLEAYGAWSGGWSFHRLGFVPQGLYTTALNSMLTFNWDMAEGANTYRLQVSTDPNFGSTVINQVTPMNSYTPQSTLAQGNYYWRVQIIRYGNVVNDWSETKQFSYSLPLPAGLTPNGSTVNYAPTLCWDPLAVYDNGEPVLTAWKYQVQVSQDPSFSSTYDSIDTYNNCWTPTKGYNDGTYYWHVAMFDGNNHMGSYSPPATFIKQYPITKLISPICGVEPGTPTFVWTPVDGAATYVLEVSLYSTFSLLYESVETINTQYTPTITYLTDMVYHWRIAIRDRDGKQGPFTDATIPVGVKNYIYLPLTKK